MEPDTSAIDTSKERLRTLRARYPGSGFSMPEAAEFLHLTDDAKNFMGMTQQEIDDILCTKREIKQILPPTEKKSPPSKPPQLT